MISITSTKRTGCNRLKPLLWLLLILALFAGGCQSEKSTPDAESSTPAATLTSREEKTREVQPTPTAAESPNQPDEKGTAEPEMGDFEAAADVTPTNRVQLPLVSDEPASTASPVPTTSVDFPVYTGPALDRYDLGVQIHLHREDLDLLMSHLTALDIGWVKVQVSWKIYEPQDDVYDDYRFNELDRLIAAANEAGLKVMLGVAKAPEWSRNTTELDGPPIEYSHFSAFTNYLASRYSGQVQAYEIWNEENLQREWNGAELSPAAAVALIEAGAEGVRRADEAAVLISGAPAPTGIDDGITAIDDRRFLQEMVNNGLPAVVDAIGVHPYGWANPSNASAADPLRTIPSHNNHRSFFFSDTLLDYKDILDRGGFEQVPLWVTEFGWGTYQGLDAEPPPGVEYMAYVDEWQQAAYTLEAYQIASEWPAVGPMIIWNLNFGPTFGSQYVESAYSLLRPDGSPRPIYHSLQTIPKTD